MRRRHLRTISLALLAGSAFLLVNSAPFPFVTIAVQPAFAQGGGGGNGGGGNNGGGNGGGGNSDSSHGNSGGSPGNSDSSHGNSGGSPGNSGGSHGNSGGGNSGGGNSAHTNSNAASGSGKASSAPGQNKSSGNTVNSGNANTVKVNAVATPSTLNGNSGNEKNLHALLGGLNSAGRNINGLLKSNDPRMAPLVQYATAVANTQYSLQQAVADANAALTDALTAQTTAQSTYDTALSAFDTVVAGDQALVLVRHDLRLHPTLANTTYDALAAHLHRLTTNVDPTPSVDPALTAYNTEVAALTTPGEQHGSVDVFRRRPPTSPPPTAM